MKLKLVTGLAALTLLGGCIIIDADDGHFRSDFNSGDHHYGTVYAADVSGQSVAFRVSSNGCSTRDFFDVDVISEHDDVYEIGVRRTRQDNCKALVPAGVEVGWTYSELGIPADAEVRVFNQVRR
ncbi:MAG: hypothetical protein ABJG15_14125 [Hyphomonadaceae bacterium]